METIKLTRQQLYDLVWTKPMYELCQQFGLSSNGLRKNCKKLNIPIPYIGYWSKLKYGKNPEKTPLPKTLDSSNAVVELKKLNEEELARHKFMLEEDKPNRTPYDVVKEEIDKMNPKLFVVPERLYAKDPLIFDTKEKYRDKLGKKSIHQQGRTSAKCSGVKRSIGTSSQNILHHYQSAP